MLAGFTISEEWQESFDRRFADTKITDCSEPAVRRA
jgi:hypothetical protein